MNTPNDYVEFKKERDLGATITDAFRFIRLEWKPFFTTILKVSIIPLMITIGALIMYIYAASNVANTLNYYDDESSLYGIGTMFFYVAVLIITGIVTYVLMHLSGLHYIKEYIYNKGTIHYSNIITNVKKDFWGFTGLSILIVLTIAVSFLLCVLPAFYTWPVMALLPMIYVFGNKDALDSYGYSFSFVSGKHWGDTFGIMFVVALIVGVLGYVFSIPSAIYQLIQMGTLMGSDDPSEVLQIFYDPVYILLTVVSYVGQFFMYSITLITNVFIYYDINEQKNASGTIEKIDNLGQS
ncbi:MAG: hypothetical protein GKR88_06385 [Flavobacteriaceae bacterium]|nr:MAG: hypothetical protein GKR88_06385 [Flavobacteriaceae bacterium]